MTETPEQMHARLCGVIGQAQFSVLGDAYAWRPITHTSALSDNALAAVRDGASWAALLPANAEAAGAYRIFAFHFAEGSNASGFVAWLASLMRAEAGTGAMVVCGYDARATDALWRTSLGLFDYWGCPWAKGDAVIALVQRLRDAGSRRYASEPGLSETNSGAGLGENPGFLWRSIRATLA